MVESSTFRAAVEFLQRAGVYDVILPFILVFTIVFAILEKTKVFGMEVIEGKEYTRKNLNAMASFVISLLVVGSAEIVEILNIVSSQVVILLFASVLFLLLVGSFSKEEKGVFLKGGWKTFFMFLMFAGIVVIFLNAFGFLEDLISGLSDTGTSETVGLIVMAIIMVFFVWFVVRDTGTAQKAEKEH
ncbi:MAG TPA: hypothetical protein VJI46_06220 [Candidatus Nanoarchaeia archaeon]|nr:hypothetical protein [Candidatus Nanoarchaeia archaeon]